MTALHKRRCGPCTACCVSLKIEAPELAKKAGEPCRHLKGGCGIYENRPDVCREFLCGWRLFEEFGDDWRPDLSGVLIMRKAPGELPPAWQAEIQAIGQLLKDEKSEALFVVDGITGLGTTHIDMDAWGIDVLIGGSQKALMIPPGLSYLAVSPRAWDRMEASYNPRYYFDLRKERKNAAKGESAYTPSVALIAAMGAALDYIAGQADGNLVEGRKKLVDNAQTCAAMTRAAATAMGFKLFAPKGREAGAATAIMAPEGTDSGTIVKGLRSKFAIIVTDGQGEMKGSLFRIAHIGFFDYMDTIAVIGALEQVAIAAKLPLPDLTFGTGLIAAQKTYAEDPTVSQK